MAKAAYPTIGIAAFVMFGTVYFIGCLLSSERKLDVFTFGGYRESSSGNLQLVLLGSRLRNDYLLIRRSSLNGNDGCTLAERSIFVQLHFDRYSTFVT